MNRMAEGGTESVVCNNLCNNQILKRMDKKGIPESGFPDLPVQSSSVSSTSEPECTAVHRYSTQDTTELKKILNKAPPLTLSQENLVNNQEERSHPSWQGSASTSNSVSSSNSSNVSGGSLQQNEGVGASSCISSIVSNTSALPSQHETQLNIAEQLASAEEASKNNLNATKFGPAPPANIIPNVMHYPIYVHQGIPSFVQVPMTTTVLSTVQLGEMISVPMVPQVIPSSSYAANFGISPTVPMSWSRTDQTTYDSRNIPSIPQGCSPLSSEENNSGSGKSYSIHPCRDTYLVRLRKPVMNMLRKKLDNDSERNWEALADVHGWNYQDILDHRNECRHIRDSPFLKLLETEQFQAYTVGQFLDDMQKIKRKDVLMELMLIIESNQL